MRIITYRYILSNDILMCLRDNEDTESGDGVAASGGPSICLHDPYRVCELSARPLPGLRSAGVQTKRRDQERETTHREPPMVTRSSSRAMAKSGVPSALTRRVRTW